MKRIILLLSCLLMAAALAACGGKETPEETDRATDTAPESVMTSKPDTDALTETAPVTDAPIETIPETEPETEPETDPDVPGAMPAGEADLSYTCGDGMVLSQYNGKTATDYYAASHYYRDNGYTLYNQRKTNGVISSTYIKDDAYCTLFFNAPKGELGIGQKETGASLLPAYDLTYEEKNETTITQINTADINGMSYIIKLADGTYIVIDGGREYSYNNFTKAFRDLHGSLENIHVRAWIISHAHGDHTDLLCLHTEELAAMMKVDTFLYAPVGADVTFNEFTERVPNAVAAFEGADLLPMHSGMTFRFADVTMEVLLTYEQVYKTGAPADFNESSAAFRLTNGEGSMMFLGDLGIAGCNWLMETYGMDGLKSDMVQVSHHGVETAPFSIYEHIRPSTVFWPCDESLMANTRGENRQPLVCADFVKEHILHGYGQATRPLSYKPAGHEYLDVLPTDPAAVKTSDNVGKVYVKDGALCYDVAAEGPANITFDLEGISTEQYNAVRVVIGSDDSNGAAQFAFTCGTHSKFRQKTLLPQGNSIDGKTNTMLLYLGNAAKFEGDIHSIRLSLGYDVGQTVEIYSIELFWLDMDD